MSQLSRKTFTSPLTFTLISFLLFPWALLSVTATFKNILKTFWTFAILFWTATMMLFASFEISVPNRRRTFSLPTVSIPLTLFRFVLTLEIGSSRTIITRSRIFFREPLITRNRNPHTITWTISRSFPIPTVTWLF